MPSWYLTNAAEIADRNKYTFYRPSPQIIEKIAVGEIVKLIFGFESDGPDAPAAERMWVVVQTVDERSNFTGRLDNQPCFIKDLSPGVLITFNAVHIISTEHDDEDDNIVEKYRPRCFVTNRILEEEKRIGYLYREHPHDKEDSGWRIMAGDESTRYMNDAKNLSFVSLGAVLRCDDSVVNLLEYPVDSAFALNPDTDTFEASLPPPTKGRGRKRSRK
jgi:hypothetical protein